MLDRVFDISATLFIVIGTILYSTSASPVIRFFAILIAIAGILYTLRTISDLRQRNNELVNRLRKRRNDCISNFITNNNE